MDWKKINSKFIESIGYDNLTKELQVLIKGKAYSHYEVPETVYSALMESKSKGGYYNKNIRGKYE